MGTVPRANAIGLLAVIGCLGLLPGCGGDDIEVRASTGPEERPTSILSIRTETEPATLSVRVANTDEERARGLMGVAELPSDHGMAFVWDDPVSSEFWMKNTLIPLSIAFWDSSGRIVGILDMHPCTSDTCPTYASPEPYVGAVEANLGWFGDRGVDVGDVVELEVGAHA